MRLSIFRTPNLAAANVAQLLLGAAWIPMWFFLNLYLQQVLGYGAFEGGAALLPMTVDDHGADGRRRAAGDRALRRPRRRSSPACSLLAAGMAVLSLVRADGSFAVDVLPASLIAAAGMALAFIPSLGTAISVGPARGGRPGLGHRQHQLPGRLRARPGGHDRRRHLARRRPASATRRR